MCLCQQWCVLQQKIVVLTAVIGKLVILGIVSGIFACNAGVTCGAFDSSNSGTCATFITIHGSLCKAQATGTSACIDDICFAYMLMFMIIKRKSSATAQLCYHNGSACAEGAFVNTNTHLRFTASSFSQCISYYDLCLFSKLVGNRNTADGVTQGCGQVQGTAYECLTLKGKCMVDSLWKYRLCQKYNSGTTVAVCVDRTCAQRIDGNTDAICQAWLTTCKTDRVDGVDITTVCTSMQGTLKKLLIICWYSIGIQMLRQYLCQY
ncbi:unnamed protein product [Paramecium sonneborni]|uniref:Uncharacterized protein n=1 Tax=Paramecium sonneborni TaxID=65129 RepID=A0A8S1RNZ4_9CILI|nr:unnamed protein product [Paramecium sonneborni]